MVRVKAEANLEAAPRTGVDINPSSMSWVFTDTTWRYDPNEEEWFGVGG